MSRTTRSSSQQSQQLRQTTLNFAPNGSNASKKADAEVNREASNGMGGMNGNGGYLKRPSPPGDTEDASGTGESLDDTERTAKRLKVSQPQPTTLMQENAPQSIPGAQSDFVKPAARQSSRPLVLELDLVALSPTKARKKGKEKEQLRYTSVPPPSSPASAVPEIMTTSATLPDLTSPPPSPSQSEYNQDSDAHDQAHTPRPLLISNQLNSRAHSRSGTRASVTPVSDSEPEHEPISRYIPLSPLTPLPQASVSRPPRPTQTNRSILPNQPSSLRIAQASSSRPTHNRAQPSSRTLGTYQDAVVAVKLEDGSKSKSKPRSHSEEAGDDGYESTVSTTSRSGGRSTTPSRIPRPSSSTTLNAQANGNGHTVSYPFAQQYLFVHDTIVNTDRRSKTCCRNRLPHEKPRCRN